MMTGSDAEGCNHPGTVEKIAESGKQQRRRFPGDARNIQHDPGNDAVNSGRNDDCKDSFRLAGTQRQAAFSKASWYRPEKVFRVRKAIGIIMIPRAMPPARVEKWCIGNTTRV